VALTVLPQSSMTSRRPTTAPGANVSKHLCVLSRKRKFFGVKLVFRAGVTQVPAAGTGLGKERWVVERTFAWLHNLRRLRRRYERDAELHFAFMLLGCAVVCQRMLSWP